MRIGVIGAGQMAEALGSGWVRAGHDVMIGARVADRADKLAQTIGPGARAGSLREAAEFGEVTLVAVQGDVLDALRQAGAAQGLMSGRPLIDCTNAFAPESFEAAPGSFVLSEEAMAERIARLASGAQVVKAFNVCAAEVWKAGPRSFEGRPLGVPLCGDDPQSLVTVGGLVRDLGFQPLPGGGLGRARYLEAMAVFVIGLWFAGHDSRAMLPPLEAAFARPD
jgi:predicted dinucleotide-binding enzyme